MQPVDHQGRLSNPPHHFSRAVVLLSTLMARPFNAADRSSRSAGPMTIRCVRDRSAHRQANSGVTIEVLAMEFVIHRTTVIGHLRRTGPSSQDNP